MTAAKRTKATPKRAGSKAKPAATAKQTKARSKKRTSKSKLVSSMKTLPKHVVDYIKENPKLALSAVAGVGLAVATSIVGPLKVLKLAANPALVALVKEVAEKALATAKAT